MNTVALGTSNATVTLSDRLGDHAQRARAAGPAHAAPRSPRSPAASTSAPPTRSELQKIYDRLGSRIGFRQEEREITAAFAAGGLGLMLAGGLLSMMWFGRLP